MVRLRALFARIPERSNFDYASCSSARRVRYELDDLFHVLGFDHREPGERKLRSSERLVVDVEISIPIPYRCNRSSYGRHEVASIPYHRVLCKNFSFFFFVQGIPAGFISVGEAQEFHLTPLIMLVFVLISGRGPRDADGAPQRKSARFAMQSSTGYRRGQ